MAHVGLFPLWFQRELSWVADVHFGFSIVKSVYADLKAFQVHVRDTGNSQVMGEQLHKSSIGMKGSFLFVKSSSDVWYFMHMPKNLWNSAQ